MEYVTLKWIHIVSSTILFGTGVGLAFFFFVAHRARELSAIQFATRVVVKGDTLFTFPAGVVQVISGLALAYELGISLSTHWLVAALFLFGFAGACWLPVVWIQLRMRDLAAAAQTFEALQPGYWRLNRAWVTLGALAFPALLIVFILMVARPDI